MAAIRCQRCGQSIPTVDPTNVRSGHSTSTSGMREWVIFERADELHLCPAARDIPTSDVADAADVGDR